MFHVHRHLHQPRGFPDSWNQFASQIGNVFDPPKQTPPPVGPAQKTTSTQKEQPTTHEVVPPSTPTPTTPVHVVVTVYRTPTPTPSPSTSDDVLEAASSTPDPTTSSTDLPESLAPTGSQSLGNSLAVAAPSAATSLASLAAIASAASPTATPTPTPDSSSGGGDVGAKAGIVIGVLAALLIVFLSLYFFIMKRKKQQRLLEDDEKLNGPFSDAAAIPASRPAGNAPRLSLRPVTQFLPNLNPGRQSRQPEQYPDRRASRGAAIAMNEQVSRPAGGSPWERQMSPAVPGGAGSPTNPFADAQRIPEEPPLPPMPVSPVENEHVAAQPGTSHGPAVATDDAVVAAAIAAGAAAAAASVVPFARKASIRKNNGPKALDLTKPMPHLDAVPPSPAGTEYSMDMMAPGQSLGPSAGAAAIAAAGGPAQSAVHRVQLDFNPTLEDELGLQAGQLVRLLHEYDDGWALCIRLDRSEQGVVPRTCLSTRPVKPRQPQGGPRGPPVNPQRGPGSNSPPGYRPMTPQGRPGGPPYPRPESPARRMTAQGPGPRPQSPAGGPPMGRPMSPGPRSQSPGPRLQQQNRPGSPSNTNRRMSPPHGPSGMNQQYRPGPPSGPVGRKPVPGQAY